MYFEEIALLAESLDLGESLRAECPVCHGTNETLSITRNGEDTILYQCFRASCDCRGAIGGSKSIQKRLDIQVKPKRKVFEGKTIALPEEVKEWVELKWGIRTPPYWYYTESCGGRIAMSVRSPHDTHRGWVLRNDGSQMPKALTYLDEGCVALSWYLSRPGEPTIVVEDIPSALRVSAYVNAVSLIGTACGDDKALEIQEYATRPIVIALDQDATGEAMQMAKRYRMLWDNPRVLPLQKDLKDMTEDELCKQMKIVEGYNKPETLSRQYSSDKAPTLRNTTD